MRGKGFRLSLVQRFPLFTRHLLDVHYVVHRLCSIVCTLCTLYIVQDTSSIHYVHHVHYLQDTSWMFTMFTMYIVHCINHLLYVRRSLCTLSSSIFTMQSKFKTSPLCRDGSSTVCTDTLTPPGCTDGSTTAYSPRLCCSAVQNQCIVQSSYTIQCTAVYF